MRLNSEAKYIELKENLYELCGVKPNRLLLAEVASCQIRNFLLDDNKINPGTATELFAYELPDTSKTVENNKSENGSGRLAGALDGTRCMQKNITKVFYSLIFGLNENNRIF